MTLGIKRLRQDRGISQVQLAKAVGISQPKLSYLERGLPPTPEEAQRLVKALEIESESKNR